jgi:hypothetical protein
MVSPGLEGSQRRRLLVELRLAGFDSDEIAARLDVSVPDVNAELSAADADIAKQLGDKSASPDEVASPLQLYRLLEMYLFGELLRLGEDPAARVNDKLKVVDAVRAAGRRA